MTNEWFKEPSVMHKEFMSVYLLFLDIWRVGPANLKGMLWFSSKKSLIL